MKRLAALAVMAAASSPALADDYPFTGYFSAVNGDLNAADAQLVCAFSFFHQESDGDFVNYLIDLPAYEADGIVRFDEEGGGTCTLEVGRLESCKVTSAVDPDDVGDTFFSVLNEITDAGVAVAGFDTADRAKSWIITGMPEPDYSNRYERCTGFDEATLKPFLTGKRPAGSVEATDALNAPPDDMTRPIMEAILKIVRGSSL